MTSEGQNVYVALILPVLTSLGLACAHPVCPQPLHQRAQPLAMQLVRHLLPAPLLRPYHRTQPLRVYDLSKNSFVQHHIVHHLYNVSELNRSATSLTSPLVRYVRTDVQTLSCWHAVAYVTGARRICATLARECIKRLDQEAGSIARNKLVGSMRK
eukprot:540002-Amphidinium_carterae.1